MRLCLALLALALAASVAPGVPAASASEDPQASIHPKVRDGVTPVHAFLDLVAGETTTDALTLVNKTPHPITFDLYTADAFQDEQGVFALRSATDPKEDLGAWVHLPLDEITLQGGERLDVAYAVEVPTDAEPGDHAGGIVALARPRPLEVTDGERELRLQVRNGVGLRIYGRVAGAAEADLAVHDLELDVARDVGALLGLRRDAIVSFEVRNTGLVRLVPSVEIDVDGPFADGRRVRRQLNELLPGRSQRVTVSVPVRSIGPLDAEVVATAQSARSTADTGRWLTPWLLIALVVLLFGGALYSFERWRTRRRGSGVVPGGGVGDEQGDELAAADALSAP